MKRFGIWDWAGNRIMIPLNGFWTDIDFKSFDEAWSWILSISRDDEDLQEYEVREL